MKKNKLGILAFCALAVVINFALGELVSMLNIPLLFLDTIGTIFIAATFGMYYGILTGVSTNLLMGLIGSPTAIPFALVNVAVAVVVALISRKNFTLPKAVLAGLVLSVVAPLIGTPIRLILFGGFTGSGTDILISALRAAGQNIFQATFLSTVASNFVDKVVSCILVSLILSNKQVKKLVESL